MNIKPSALMDAIEVLAGLLTRAEQSPWMVSILLKRVPPMAWGVGLAEWAQEEAFMMATARGKPELEGPTPKADVWFSLRPI